VIKIVTDSTCDLPVDVLRRYDVHIVPINIQFGRENFKEGIDIDQATFYRKIDELGIIPTTSQPSAGEFVEAYRGLARQGATSIISLHVTGKLSGTVQSAELAKSMIADEVDVHVFDSLNGSAGLGFMIVEAARLAEARRSPQEIMHRLEEMRPHVHIFLALANLKFAQMSGRVGKLQGALASMLDVKPIIGLDDGLLDVVERVRTRKAALSRMLAKMAERVGTDAPVNLAVIHAEAPDEARETLDQAKRIFQCNETFVDDLAISLAVHFGPGTVGVVAYRVS
jgi:DegV family protein with EDD domain